MFDSTEFGITAKDARAMAVSTRKLIELSFLALLGLRGNVRINIPTRVAESQKYLSWSCEGQFYRRYGSMSKLRGDDSDRVLTKIGCTGVTISLVQNITPSAQSAQINHTSVASFHWRDSHTVEQPKSSLF